MANTILKSKEKTHPLALLANQLRLVAERELTIFFPVIRQWSPESIMVSVKQLHQYYGERLVCSIEIIRISVVESIFTSMLSLLGTILFNV